ncbi:LADA_0H09868g1_1 [Lachancea dasiensis]|uniref:LADA_0H09868g1_1 n=1 Tax=Lachancea dasiensis TaxID=1072105 RepID=A0A1G4K2X1_9SACH|nr:LADA_0H09868g1_1 [Lachancea dasiensis]
MSSDLETSVADSSKLYLAADTDADDASSMFSMDSGYLMDLADASEDTETVLPKTDFHSPYYVNVPTPSQSALSSNYSDSTIELATGFVREYPTDILLDRFTKWRKILKGLANYLREVAFAQERFARINYGLRADVKFSFLTDLEDSTNRIIDPFQQRAKKPGTAQPAPSNNLRTPEEEPSHRRSSSNTSGPDWKANVPVAPGDESSASSGFMKFGSGSIEDIQVILKKYHSSLGNQQIKMSKELSTVVVPKLDDLRKDLQLKIKEIKELHNDFKTNIGEHIALTGQLLQKYMAAVKFMSTQVDDQKLLKFKGHNLKPKHDPYLLKLQLDLQLKRQLLEENYLQEAYINLQSSGMELEKIIYGEIQQTLQRYSALVSTTARISISNLCNELHQGLLSKPPATEWDHFVAHHPKCLVNWKSTEPIPQPRKLSDIRYPKMKSSLAKCIKAGYLLKKSQILKNYNKGYFVLTSNYLHEFKSSNFFKLSQEVSEKKDHGEVQTGNKKRAMVPVASLHLNSANVVDVGEQKFSIRGIVSSSNFDKKSAETGKIISKSTSSIQKFLKSSAKSPQNKKDGGHHSISGPSGPGSGSTEESEDVAICVFKVAGNSNHPDEGKDLRKWVTELKNLTNFDNATDRAKFIEEKILRAHSRASSLNLMKTNTGSKSSHASNIQSFKKPQYIHLGTNELHDPMLARAKINTPAIDDNGNLITAGEGRSSSVKSLPEYSSPAPSPGPGFAPAPSPGPAGQVLSPSAKQGFVITSNGMTPISKTPGQTSRRTAGQTSSRASSDGSGKQPLTSPSSHISGGSGGGYFAIPVHPSSQASTPGLEPVPDSTVQSQGAAPVLPHVKLNDRAFNSEEQDRQHLPSEAVAERNVSGSKVSEGGPINRGAPVHNLRRNISTGNMDNVAGESPHSVYQNPKYVSSSQSLLSGSAQHARKHKKNVSFGSLNSLLFSKKAGDIDNNNMTDYFMSGNRIEEDHDGGASLNVNHSLYKSRTRSP